ncbi:FG-GAP repeat domain-containing protein [Streptomyces sp. NPDC020472]|uniref:FG-GAP repeat domain-containing protein n=1 Tax=Streptomyces sp. NPDC020472 TaxID=3365075 RepID=UPI003794D50C
MTRTHRPRRHRLATAVAVALAVTAGPLAAVPAVATTSAVTTTSAATAEQAAQEDVLPFLKDSAIVGTGPTGFLTRHTDSTYRWTRYADGVTTTLPTGSYRSSRQTDIVTKVDGTVYTMYDMATGAEPVVVDLSPGEGYGAAQPVGSALLTTKADETGHRGLHLVRKTQGTVVDDKVTGFPADAVFTHIDLDSPDTAVALYTATVDGALRNRVAVVDLATHTVVEQHDTERVTRNSDTALSATHLAWVEKPTEATSTLVTVRRDTGETRRIPLGNTGFVTLDLVGDWLTYGQPGGTTATSPSPLWALTARSLTTGDTVPLLDAFTNSTTGPDGTQLVRGGTLAQGEGLYKVSAGADGAPVVTRVANAGTPTALEVGPDAVPETIDFDRTSAPIPFTWTLSRLKVKTHLEVVHTATGTKATLRPHFSVDPMSMTAQWTGKFSDGTPAYNGAYTWRLTVEPLNGIGPAVERSGTFTVVRKPHPHDFTDNGAPDLLVRNRQGGLSLFEERTTPSYTQWNVAATWSTTGWNIYDRLLAPGNFGGSPHADIFARDKSGVLWLHQGTGKGLAPRVKVSAGWQIYDKITGGSDFTGDGRPDLLATDKAGVLWLHPGTGSAAAPFAARKKISGGWGIYNSLAATGNIGGGPAGDFVARDKYGVLWLFLGKGDGTFVPRTRISTPLGSPLTWVSDLTVIGDADHDGRTDLVASHSGGFADLFKGTGDWRAPFTGPKTIYTTDDNVSAPVTIF